MRAYSNEFINHDHITHFRKNVTREDILDLDIDIIISHQFAIMEACKLGNELNIPVIFLVHGCGQIKFFLDSGPKNLKIDLVIFNNESIMNTEKEILKDVPYTTIYPPMYKDSLIVEKAYNKIVLYGNKPDIVSFLANKFPDQDFIWLGDTSTLEELPNLTFKQIEFDNINVLHEAKMVLFLEHKEWLMFNMFAQETLQNNIPIIGIDSPGLIESTKNNMYTIPNESHIADWYCGIEIVNTEYEHYQRQIATFISKNGPEQSFYKLLEEIDKVI
jgi:hypothetical protein